MAKMAKMIEDATMTVNTPHDKLARGVANGDSATVRELAYRALRATLLPDSDGLAQVYATLALAAATARGVVVGDHSDGPAGERSRLFEPVGDDDDRSA